VPVLGVRADLLHRVAAGSGLLPFPGPSVVPRVMPATLPIVVVGAGAAGLMAAIHAAGGDRPVLLLERTRDGGRKILISGGGRCNVLPSAADPARYVTASSPNTMRKLLLSWPLAEQRRFFEQELGLSLVLEPETGKLFPASNRARDVRDGLVSAARRRGVEIRFEAALAELRPPSPAGGPWTLVLEDGAAIAAGAVILATGGLSVPATGSDGRGIALLRRLGHTIHETYPALTPLTATPPVHAPLAGVSLDVTLHAGTGGAARTARGGFLFTHRGYSGPAVLDVSHVTVLSRLRREPRAPVLVQWSADRPEWERRLLAGGPTRVGALLRRELPDRLADLLVEAAAVPPDRALAELRRDERTRLLDVLTAFPLPWTGDEGYRKAEVTGGGVALGEVDPRTLASRILPGLHLCGELLDAFGPIGGYNFLWAWSTGRAAGLGAARQHGERG
jgi:predicted Rossmann fold flavoprotein